MFTNTFNKKKYFTQLAADAAQVIADLEFKKFAAQHERETARRQYDQHQDAMSRIEARLKGNPSKEETDKLNTEKASIEKNIKDIKGYMDSIDATIYGGQPSELLPDGSEGIDNKLKSWATRQELIKKFISLNC